MLRKNNIAYQKLAEDSPMYISLSTGDYGPMDWLIKCIEQINSWMCHHLLKLNKDKTEISFSGATGEK